jgi:putative membrane protein
MGGAGAWLALFVFGVLHEIGAHYTYSEVPYERWLQALTGTSPEAWLGTGRNQYDRAIHFCYGLLVAPAAMQLLEARATPRGWWRWLLPVAFITSHSVLYEFIEWAAAIVFGGDLRMAYLGTQGDPWDAQQDMLHALAGAAITVTLVLAWRRRRSSRPPAKSSGRRSRTAADRGSRRARRSRTPR